MQTPEAFGPAERLYAAVRERAPKLAVAIAHDDETGLPHVHVTAGYAGPWTVRWKGGRYQGRVLETDPWTRLPHDPGEAAEAIVDTLQTVDASQRP
ncbi:hypothetical protein GCM10022254_57170 [Actinomadura meridiana]|uniref:DUF4160 domain-containing protein n=1 Tax=Actinomadura meridiana TaxID=559626 RepID=A0ABP8CGG1_9ACTN